jgi:hypothetical protein
MIKYLASIDRDGSGLIPHMMSKRIAAPMVDGVVLALLVSPALFAFRCG